ncbi:hypothetical protein M413DRAFT_438742 [Hebeloma cylindrosporum]|uniref:Senescence domain-containing protein n=1 Tax=Hebeloma cylindrosporum TaxID=76867 RepID=A0A0C2YIH3_HEBCY|nr:hypothetical protein M413DRAFT_438742 [Hebeloma cylindrosporum h7]
MLSLPEAFVLLTLPNATLKSTGFAEVGVLNLECVTLPIPEAKSTEERTVYLVLRLNNSEIPIDPDRVVERSDVADMRTYTFAETPSDPTHLILTLKGPRSDAEFVERLNTFDNILEQYAVNFKGTSSANAGLGSAPAPPAFTTREIGSVTSNKDLRGHLVMINEDTGEVVGEVEDRFRIREDPVMYEKGHENEPVIIEVAEESNVESDANALEAFARMVPPDQQNWITKSASIVSHAISMTTTLLVTTITTASSYYISNSAASPHHSGSPANSPPSTSRGGTPGPPPLPPRALVFLTSEKTRKGLSTVHAMSGQAVKVSTKTIGLIDGMIRRAMGAKPKRTKYFPHGVPASGPSGRSLAAGPPLPSRSPSPSPSSYSTLVPPPYSPNREKPGSPRPGPALPPRRSLSPAPPLPPRSGEVQPRLTTKDHILISADLILSTIDHSTRRMLDVGTEEIGKVVGHKYGPEAAQSSLLMAGTARNVGLVYVDMRGIGRRALLKRAGKTFVKARVSSNHVPMAPSPPSK